MQKAPKNPQTNLFVLLKLVDLQCVLVSGAQQNNSVLYIYKIYAFSYSFPLWFITGC